MNARQWNARKKRLTEIETLKWSKEEKFHIGAKLLEIAIVHGGGFFELEYINIRGKTERQGLSDKPMSEDDRGLSDIPRSKHTGPSTDALQAEPVALQPGHKRIRGWLFHARC